MGIQLKNNVSSTLAAAISASDVGMTVATGTGAQFPTLGASDYFYATLESSQGTQEIVKVTVRSGDNMTIVRAQDGSTANSFGIGARIELRINAAAINDLVDQVTASQVGVTPYSWIGATDAQSAFEEVVNDLAASSGTSLVGHIQSGSGAVARTVQAKLRETVSVMDFGAVGDGVTDDTAAVADAIAAVKAAGGGVVNFPAGNYLLEGVAGADGTKNGILIPFTQVYQETERVYLKGEGRSTILSAGSNNMYLVRLSDNNCRIDGFTFNANGKTSCTALGLVPENVTTNATVVYQTFNVVNDLFINGFFNGIVFLSGVPVLGVDSGCWYNNFSNIHIYSCLRGIYFQGMSGHSGSNTRNFFQGIRIGQVTNTGIQIDDGSTNVFVGVHMEGILTGTSPSSSPTAIRIANTGLSGLDNNSNKFFGCIQESCTVSLNNANASSEFYGCEFPTPYSMVLTANPKIMIGSDSSITPQFLPGYVFQNGSQIAGIPNNVLNATGAATNLLEVNRQTEVTGPGGSPSLFSYAYDYEVTGVYLVTRGGYVNSSNYAMRSSYWYETVQGTFVESATKILDVSAGGVTWTSDTVGRTGGGVGNVFVSIEVSKAAAIFTNWATISKVG